MFKITAQIYKLLHSGSPCYFGPPLTLKRCSYSTKHSQLDCQYLTAPPFNSTLYKLVKHFGHSFPFDARKFWSDLSDKVHSSASGKSSNLACLQKSLPHSLPIIPVSHWYNLAMLLDLRLFTLFMFSCAWCSLSAIKVHNVTLDNITLKHYKYQAISLSDQQLFSQTSNFLMFFSKLKKKEKYKIIQINCRICTFQVEPADFWCSRSCRPAVIFNEFLILPLTLSNCIIKRPTRDACLCMGDLQAPAAPTAPAAPDFVFFITL